MASAYFKQFAIKNNLTIDYGYMYGKYRGLFISLKETLGSTKILYIMGDYGKNKEQLKTILSVFTEEELPKYCVTDLKVESNYVQFTFEISNDKCHLIDEFLNKFIDSCLENDKQPCIICPICGKNILDDESMVTVDISGIITPTHSECYEKGKEEVKQKVKEKSKEVNKDRKGIQNGLLGAIVFGIIYMAILILSFFFVQFILNNAASDDKFVLVLQYFPVLCALFACPLICYGYDSFKGAKGSSKYIIVLWTVLITTLLGTFFGFVASLLLVADNVSFMDLLELVGRLITCKDITGSTSFRWMFYLYIFIAMGLAVLSMVFKFSGKTELEEANNNTFEKLD